VAAARRAFDPYSRTTPGTSAWRFSQRILIAFNARDDEIATAIIHRDGRAQ
jgi:hypothetical protein